MYKLYKRNDHVENYCESLYTVSMLTDFNQCHDLTWTWPSPNVAVFGHNCELSKRPVPRANETVKVYFELYIAQLIKVDEVSQIMETKLWLKQRWKRSFFHFIRCWIFWYIRFWVNIKSDIGLFSWHFIDISKFTGPERLKTVILFRVKECWKDWL